MIIGAITKNTTTKMLNNIKAEGEKLHYFDKNGEEIFGGDTIRWSSGREETVYLTENGELGTDATNPAWLESGRAFPCQYGIYPFTYEDLSEIEKVI